MFLIKFHNFLIQLKKLIKLIKYINKHMKQNLENIYEWKYDFMTY